MAVTYSSDGGGNDMLILAGPMTEFNRKRFIIEDGTDGLKDVTIQDFADALVDTSDDDKRILLGQLTSLSNQERLNVTDQQSNWREMFDSWVTVRLAEQLNSEFADVDGILTDLAKDFVTNSKSVPVSVTVLGTPSSEEHFSVSDMHVAATLREGSTKSIDYTSEKASETITFRVSNTQNGSGVTTFSVAGDTLPDPEFPDLSPGWGNLGGFSTRGWEDGGRFQNPGFEEAGDGTAEASALWRGFTAFPFIAAPDVTLLTRETVAADIYHGSGYAQMDGDGAITDLYMAQLMHNPLLDANATAWGTDVNDDTGSGQLTGADEKKLFFVIFRYRNVTAAYTLTPFMGFDDSERAPDETILAVTADDSDTWRKAAFTYLLQEGEAKARIEGGLKISAAPIASGSNAKIDVLQFIEATLIGNFWAAGNPSITPASTDAELTVLLTQTSISRWANYFKDYTEIEGGQTMQLPSDGSPTELDALIKYV